MVKIIIENLGQKELSVKDLNKTMLQHFHSHFIDWMQACGGKGRCTTCKMRVVQGMEHLSELTAPEKKYAQEGLLMENERLACQVKVQATLIVSVPDESKLPHIKYTF